MTDTSELRKKAIAVLNGNQHGICTLPSKNLYPFQWNWDTAFIAIGYAHFDVKRACEEYRSLFRAQWKNGFLPHIVFWDEGKSADYFPGPSFYNIDISSGPAYPIKTSAITQPPIHAFALDYMLRISNGDEQFWGLIKELFVPLYKYHSYLYKNRDPGKEGLVYINHPWESGTDNSPAWDGILRGMAYEIKTYDIRNLRRDIKHVNSEERPGDFEYQCYLHLIDLFKKHDYDDNAIFEDAPFAVQDPLFNALLIRSNEALIKIADKLGHADKAREIRGWNRKSIQAINSKLFNPKTGTYANYDLKNEKIIDLLTSSSFAPLITDAPGQEQVGSMLRLLHGPEFSGTQDNLFPVPSTSFLDPNFNPKKYWRGPVWVNMNWLIMQGLMRHGENKLAERIRQKTIDMVMKTGFYEYFDPRKNLDQNGEGGYGSSDFSWTASLIIDLLSRS